MSKTLVCSVTALLVLAPEVTAETNALRVAETSTETVAFLPPLSTSEFVMLPSGKTSTVDPDTGSKTVLAPSSSCKKSTALPLELTDCAPVVKEAWSPLSCAAEALTLASSSCTVDRPDAVSCVKLTTRTASRIVPGGRVSSKVVLEASPTATRSSDSEDGPPTTTAPTIGGTKDTDNGEELFAEYCLAGKLVKLDRDSMIGSDSIVFPRSARGLAANTYSTARTSPTGSP